MRTDRHAGRHREFDRPPHRCFIAGVTAASDVRGTDQTEQSLVFRPALAEVGV